ncbi:polysaccharide export protein [Coniochaeta sp. 2T2.1]|nr:polysaccharide export protein [Coniochaeta sp. 2T2.1]
MKRAIYSSTAAPSAEPSHPLHLPRHVATRIRAYRRQILTVLGFFLILDAFLLISDRPPSYTTRPLATPGQVAANSSVFIVSVHRNTEEILRSAWNDAVLNLVSYLGAANVHFVAVESGSQDKTKEALMDLKGKLDGAGVSNTISLGMTVWEQLDELENRPDPRREREPGWIWDKEEGHYDLRRIPYLAKVRNQAMEPLKTLEKQGRTFDKVLWLNDIVFDVEDYVTLLNTHDGRYAAACSMDFKLYPYYYDTFALRDDRGMKTASYHWPWFISPTARQFARKGEPVRVESCWNGMVLFDSTPFYANPPLQFRGIDDSLADLHLEGSECCLIHADNVLSRDPDKGVWLNPNVRVTIQQRLSKWRSETPTEELSRTEVGVACLINEMQIMWQNGWKHL